MYACMLHAHTSLTLIISMSRQQRYIHAHVKEISIAITSGGFFSVIVFTTFSPRIAVAGISCRNLEKTCLHLRRSLNTAIWYVDENQEMTIFLNMTFFVGSQSFIFLPSFMFVSAAVSELCESN